MEKLGEVLLAIGAMSAGALNRALAMQRSAGGRLGTILLEQGIVTEETLARALSKVTGRNYARWERVKDASRETVALLPARVAVRLFAVPFEAEGRVLRVAMRDPGDLAAEDELALATGKRIEPWTLAEVRIMEALERFYGERRPARYRVLADRLERGIRPQAPPPVPPPPPDIRGGGRPAEPESGATTVPGFSPTSDIWRRMPTVTDEIEIATWRPASFARPTPPPAAGLDFSTDEDEAPPEETGTEPPSHPEPPFAPPAAISPAPPAEPASGAPVSSPPPGPPTVEPAPVAPAPDEIPAMASAEKAPSRPESLDEARERIRSAEVRDDIAEAALSYVEPFFPLAALFIARKDDVIGWQVRSPSASRSAFKAVRVPFHEPSIFLNVRLSGAPYQGPLPDLPSHAPILEAFGRKPEQCAVFPVFLRRRIVAFLFVEHAGAALPRERVDEMKNLASAIADGLAALIVQQRSRP